MAYAPVYNGVESDNPAAGDVREGVTFGTGLTGTLEVPVEDNVRLATTYGEAGTEFTGNLVPGGTVIDIGSVAWLD